MVIHRHCAWRELHVFARRSVFFLVHLIVCDLGINHIDYFHFGFTTHTNLSEFHHVTKQLR